MTSAFGGQRSIQLSYWCPKRCNLEQPPPPCNRLKMGRPRGFLGSFRATMVAY